MASNALGVDTHVLAHEQKQFQKTRCTPDCGQNAPGDYTVTDTFVTLIFHFIYHQEKYIIVCRLLATC